MFADINYSTFSQDVTVIIHELTARDKKISLHCMYRLSTTFFVHMDIWNVPPDIDPCKFTYIALNSLRYIIHKVYAINILFSMLYFTPLL